MKKTNALSKPQRGHLNKVLAALNVTRCEWQHILESGIVRDIVEGIRSRGCLVRSQIRPALGLDKWPEPTHFDVMVRVNRKLNLRGAAWLTGCETQPAEHIPDRSFLGALEEDVNLTIFHFGKGRQMHHHETLEELKAYGYRPVLVEELLALSAQHPHLQTKFPIAGVGCNEGKHHFWMIDCPALVKGPRKRRVDGHFSNSGTIYDFYRVAAVRDPKIIPTKNIFFPNTTAEREIKFVDAEYAAMLSVYRPIAA